MSSKCTTPGFTAAGTDCCMRWDFRPAPRLTRLVARIAATRRDGGICFMRGFRNSGWISRYIWANCAAAGNFSRDRNTETRYSFFVCYNLLPRLAEAFDSQRHSISGFQVNWPIHSQCHTRRRSGADYIAGKQRHELAHVAQELGHAEDHLFGIALLAHRSVYLEPHFQVARFGNFFARRDKRP